jgi:catechol 2,3-dioxygenase-like lactoylglutathione lyase family enzyme
MSESTSQSAAADAAVAVGRGLPGLTRLDHVGLTVPDIEEATAFLVDVLGFEYLYTLGPLADDGDWMRTHLNVHPRAVAQQIRFFRCAGTPVLEVFEYDAPGQRTDVPLNSDCGGHHVALYVEDLDAAVRYLREQGVRVLGDPTTSVGPHQGQRWVYFLAPWGAQFELVSYPYGRAWYRVNDPSARGSNSSPFPGTTTPGEATERRTV